jgi:hypothetical protein
MYAFVLVALVNIMPTYQKAHCCNENFRLCPQNTGKADNQAQIIRVSFFFFLDPFQCTLGTEPYVALYKYINECPSPCVRPMFLQ